MRWCDAERRAQPRDGCGFGRRFRPQRMVDGHGDQPRRRRKTGRDDRLSRRSSAVESLPPDTAAMTRAARGKVEGRKQPGRVRCLAARSARGQRLFLLDALLQRAGNVGIALADLRRRSRRRRRAGRGRRATRRASAACRAPSWTSGYSLLAARKVSAASRYFFWPSSASPSQKCASAALGRTGSARCGRGNPLPPCRSRRTG